MPLVHRDEPLRYFSIAFRLVINKPAVWQIFNIDIILNINALLSSADSTYRHVLWVNYIMLSILSIPNVKVQLVYAPKGKELKHAIKQ